LCLTPFVDVFFLLLKETKIKRHNQKIQEKENEDKNDIEIEDEYKLLSFEKELTQKLKEGIAILQKLSKEAIFMVPDTARLEGCYELFVNNNPAKAKKEWQKGYKIAKELDMKYHQAKLLYLLGEQLPFPEISSELMTKKDVLTLAQQLFAAVGATQEVVQCVVALESAVSPLVVPK
jgi:hypothetical protein